MRQIYTEIEINAPDYIIWRILMNYEQYPEWNPFVRSIEGGKEEGEDLKIELQNGDSLMTFTPKIQEAQQNKKFSWLGKLFLPRIFDGEHIFEIEPINEQSVKFIQRENFRGLLVWIILKFIGENTKESFIKMNQALRHRAETLFETENKKLIH